MFCRNDIDAIYAAFVNGLKVEKSNIIICGISGFVTKSDLTIALTKLQTDAQANDVLLMYFSGHGGIINGNHNLILSDSFVQTQEIITTLETIATRSKVLFLDCCMAGNFTVNETAVFDINETAAEFVGKGYAVIASSNATQYSYGRPDKPVSLFTSFLCEAITRSFIIKKGRKSLYDIQKSLFMFLESWNKANPSQVQNPIYRANIGGTIFFDIANYHPYIVKDFFDETDNYIIKCVKPVHSSVAKRYSVFVILKAPFSLNEISLLNHEIVEKVKGLNIFGTKQQEEHWRSGKANIVFSYFGLDEDDIIEHNFICHTTWVDNTQDKTWWYRLYKNDEVINDIHFNMHSYYQSLKIFTQEHTALKDDLVKDTMEIMSQMITQAEKVIALYNEYLNEITSENVFIDEMSKIIPNIERLYFAETSLDIPPKDLKEWCQFCSNLSATIHDFTLFYGQNAFLKRTSENRIACMNMTIERYYQELEKWKAHEQNIKGSGE